jgi:hypothetical protein
MSQTVRTLLAALSVCVAAGVSAAVAAAADTAPSNTSPPTISGKATVGQTLTASTGAWDGTQPLTYTYVWQSCNANGGACSAIAGATNGTYTLVAADRGKTLRVVVTAKNGAGSASATSVPTGVVAVRPIGAITLDVSTHLVVYGSQIVLSGRVDGNGANRVVTIRGNGYPFQTGGFGQVAVTRTDAIGNFSVPVKPGVNTSYYAVVGTQRSQSLVVNVRPRVMVKHKGAHHFVIQALADKSLAGKLVLVQRWAPKKHVWISIERLRLHGSLDIGTATVAATSFTLRSFAGTMTRIYLPLTSVSPGYVSSTSSAFTA